MMKKCEKCGFTTEDSDISFCVNCGNKMTEMHSAASADAENRQICKKCGFANKSNVKFCIKCGAPFEYKKVDLSKKAAPIREVFPEESAEEIYPAERNKPSVPENAGALSNDTVPAAPKKSKGGVIAACIAAAALIAVAVLVFVIPHNSEDKLSSEEISETTTASETTETMTMTTMTEKITEEAAETTAATTALTETSITETEAAEGGIIPNGEDPMIYSFSGGSISFTANNRFYRFDEEDYEYYSSYYSYIPAVIMSANNEAAKKIENTLNNVLQIHYQNGEDKYAFEIGSEPGYSLGSMTFSKSIECVAEDSGMLFVTVGDYEDWGGSSYLSRCFTEQTFIFDTATGDNYVLADLVTNKSAFTKAVDNYIRDIVYDNSYHTAENDEYELAEEVGFDTFDERLKENPWLENNSDGQ